MRQACRQEAFFSAMCDYRQQRIPVHAPDARKLLDHQDLMQILDKHEQRIWRWLQLWTETLAKLHMWWSGDPTCAEEIFKDRSARIAVECCMSLVPTFSQLMGFWDTMWWQQHVLQQSFVPSVRQPWRSFSFVLALVIQRLVVLLMESMGTWYMTLNTCIQKTTCCQCMPVYSPHMRASSQQYSLWSM